MSLIKSIAIEKPCDQSWQQMTEESNGRYCSQCCKTVIDFTRMSNTEIIKYLSSGTNVCGRFNPGQMPALNMNADSRSSRFSWKSIIAACSLLIISHEVNAVTEIKPNVVQMNASFKTVDETAGEDTLKNILVKGKITDKGDTSPIPGVTIRIKGTPIGTLSDTSGNFILRVPNITDVLVVSFIGYSTQEIHLSRIAENQDYNIKMQAAQGLMGEVVVTKRMNRLQTMWYKIKRIF